MKYYIIFYHLSEQRNSSSTVWEDFTKKPIKVVMKPTSLCLKEQLPRNITVAFHGEFNAYLMPIDTDCETTHVNSMQIAGQCTTI